MGFYQKHILPHFINAACGTRPIMKQREKIVPQCAGVVLEVGMGTGLNMPFYDGSKVTHVYGLEPVYEMRRRAEPVAAQAPFSAEFIDLPGEEIPLADASVDTVLLTFTLCTIPDTMRALAGMARVPKPAGRLIFCEHGRAPDARIIRWQNRLNSVWKSIAGGCNMNRDIPDLLQKSGFAIDKIDTMYLPGTPRVLGFNYWGTASRK